MSAVVLDALAIATALGGKKQGRAYWVCCPAHSERTPSLKLEDTPTGGCCGSALALRGAAKKPWARL